MTLAEVYSDHHIIKSQQKFSIFYFTKLGKVLKVTSNSSIKTILKFSDMFCYTYYAV